MYSGVAPVFFLLFVALFLLGVSFSVVCKAARSARDSSGSSFLLLYARSPCLRRVCNSFLEGFFSTPFFLIGLAPQSLWSAGHGPWQFAHCGGLVYGPGIWSMFLCPQFRHLATLLHLAGLQYPMHPGSWISGRGVLSIRRANPLVPKSLNLLTGSWNETIHVASPVSALYPCLLSLQLTGLSPV